MEKLRIIETLVPALDTDFFTPESRQVLESVSVFMKSVKTGFCGPHYLENLFLDEIVRFMEADFYYIIRPHSNRQACREFTFKLIIRTAGLDDFYWTPIYERWMRVYYLRLENKMIQGPLYFTPDTDVATFTKQLELGRVFVPNERQDFAPALPKKLAS